MSDSEILLDITVADASSEVMVVDSNFRVLARGIHGVQLHVPPGIYRAKTRVGELQSESLFSVAPDEPGQHKRIELPALQFASPMPLQQTSTSREFHQGAICNASSGTNTRLGEGAALIIFLRDPSLIYFSLNDAQMESYARNFSGLTLGKLDDSTTHPLETLGTLVAERGYLIASIALDPGCYTLSRQMADGGRLSLPLVVPAGWSLQVFVPMLADDPSALNRQIDLAGAAMLFDRPGVGFRPDRADLRILEVARQALARGHNVIDSNSMNTMLSGTIENPMLGLLAAHLLLLARHPDLELAESLIVSTGKLIGPGYPDLLALRWKLAQLRGNADAASATALLKDMTLPPMLQLSWHHFMQAYAGLADKQALRADLSRIAEHWLSSSVWSSWLEHAENQAAPAAADTKTDSAKHSPRPAPSASAESLPPKMAGAKSMSPGASGLAEISWAIASTVSYLGKEVGDFLGSLDRRQDSQAEASDALEPALQRIVATLVAKEQQPDADDLARAFAALVARVDWKSVLAALKNAAPADGQSPLSSLQRRLLLSLKAAREGYEDDGELPDNVLWKQTGKTEVSTGGILDALKSIILIAAQTGNEPLLTLARAIATSGRDDSMTKP